MANTLDVPGIRRLIQMINIRDITPGAGTPNEEWSFTLRKIWPETMVLMNFMLRLAVHMGKVGAVTGLRDQFQEEIHNIDLKKITVTGLDSTMDELRNGALYVAAENGKERELRPRLIKHVDLLEGTEENNYQINGYYNNEGILQRGAKISGSGANAYHELLLQYFDLIKARIENLSDAFEPSNLSQEIDAATKKTVEDISAIYKATLDLSNRADKYQQRRGLLNKFAMYEPYVYDQYNASGVKAHPFLFAKPGSAIFNYEVTFDLSVNQPFGEMHGLPKEIGDANPSHIPSQEPIQREVNSHGIFVDGFNEELFNNFGRFPQPPPEFDSHKQLKPELKTVTIQGVRRKDIVRHPEFWTMLTYIESEWSGYIDQWRDGRHSPNSKTAEDYIAVHDRKNFNYASVDRQMHGIPTTSNPSFDREALKDSGRTIYRGRNSYTDTKESQIDEPPHDPFPRISTMGISKYLKSLLDRFADEAGNKQLRYFVWDDQTQGNVFSHYPEAKK
ncbi:MAG: hypothetical protein O2779_02570 [Nanoarchaeota archaeon]|nr:hypothetical protein [Nanoarchaeota archaeon]